MGMGMGRCIIDVLTALALLIDVNAKCGATFVCRILPIVP
jgi:hypothetical protein